jgi:hypothetical protein
MGVQQRSTGLVKGTNNHKGNPGAQHVIRASYEGPHVECEEAHLVQH